MAILYRFTLATLARVLNANYSMKKKTNPFEGGPNQYVNAFDNIPVEYQKQYLNDEL